jgi:hypothetical protein
MAGRVEPLRLSVKPNTKKARKQPAVRRKFVVLDGHCMGGIINQQARLRLKPGLLFREISQL